VRQEIPETIFAGADVQEHPERQLMNHRFTLRRSWMGDGGIVNFIMLNPSTADDVFDDATIRRCVGFAKRWGFSGLVVTNLFAYRATQPNDLWALVNLEGGRDAAIGEGNNDHIEREAKSAKMVVCAWGDNCELIPLRDLEVIQLLLRDRNLYCIRRTVKGNPVHPVRERYTDAPELFYSKTLNEPGSIPRGKV
jgi:hypothetical protein